MSSALRAKRPNAVAYEVPEVAPTILGGSGNGPGNRARSGDAKDALIIPEVANPLTARMFKGVNTTMDEGQTMIGEPLSFQSNAGSQGLMYGEGVSIPLKVGGDGVQSPAVAFQPRFARNGRGGPSDVAYPLTAEAGRTGKGHSAQAIAFDTYNQTVLDGVSQTLCSRGDTPGGNAHLIPAIASNWVVRRLTVIECERLQGFSDNFTNIPWRGRHDSPDGPRYKALGNSMSLNVMRWLGRRIQMVESLDAA